MQVLFINFAGGSLNCLGIPSLAQFSADCRGAIEMFSRLGEVSFHDPYVAKNKSKIIKDFWPNRQILSTSEVLAQVHEFDCFVTRFGGLAMAGVTGQSNFGSHPDCFPLLEAVESTGRIIYNISADARPHVFPIHTQTPSILSNNGLKEERVDWLSLNLIRKLVNSGRFKILWPAVEIPIQLSSIENIVGSNFADYFALGYTPIESPGDWHYDYIYGGLAPVKEPRKSRLLKLTSLIDNKATVGKVKLGSSKEPWPSATNFKNVSNTAEYLHITSQAKLNIVFGEPWHNFPSIRFWESLVSGSIIGVDSSYIASARLISKYGLSDRILTDGEATLRLLARSSDTDYKNQLDFYYQYLRDLPDPIF